MNDEYNDNGNNEPESKSSFVGTEDYVAPEIIKSEESSYATDLWSLGIIIFLFFTGKTPFKGSTPFYTFEKILACEYELPNTIPIKARDLIEKLLRLDPSERLGAGSYFGDTNNSIDALKSPPFFDGINFSTLSLD